MMTKEQFDAWCTQNYISGVKKAMIQRVREGDPLRRVRSFKNNVPGFYPSKKMGMTIQFESHTLELRYIYELEHDDDVLEYYDQALMMKLKIRNKAGRTITIPAHKPDFFVLRKSSVGVEECKPVEHLEKGNEEYVGRFELDEEGKWISPAGIESASQLGLYYKVNDDQDPSGHKTLRYRNLMFLEDYLSSDKRDFTEEEQRFIVDLVRTSPGIPLIDLLDQSREVGIKADAIYHMVVEKVIFVDLEKFALAEPHYATVYQDQDIYRALTSLSPTDLPMVQHNLSLLHVKAGEKFIWDGSHWTILNLGDTYITGVDSQGNIAQLPYELIEKLAKSNAIQGIQMKPENQNREMIQKILASADEQDYRIANERKEALDRLSRGEDVDVPSRTLRSWRSRYKEAEMLFGMGYLGLLPRNKERGNHNPRMEEAIKKLMKEHIELDYLNIKQKKIALSYGSFCTKCEASGYPSPPSYKTYGKAIQEVDIERRKRRREGKKAAYQYQSSYLYLEFTTPRHGDRVFEIGHIDHTQLDIELVDSRTGKVLGRPWLTFLIDAFSRRVLAMYLTFDPPSYRSCMMVLRECVRRHARLPKTIVVDGGKDFHSIYFDSLLAMYECTKKIRPPAQARVGAVIERLFGKTNTQFLYALLGNTQASKKHRQMTKETDPKKHAVWTLKALNEQLGNYVYEVYDQLEHPTLGMKPGEAFQQSISLSGMRESQFIAYNDDFIMMTSPTTKKGTALVGVNGVKINNIYYNNIALRRFINKQLPIRYDPFDMGVAYVYAQKRWIKCISQYYAIFKGRTEKEIKLITDEIKVKNKNNSKNFSINAVTIARFITNVENEEWILQQRRKDLEGRETRNLYEENVPIPEEEDDCYEDADSDQEEEIEGDNEFEGYGEF